MITNLRRAGFRYLLYISPDVPEITEMFREGDSRGYFIRRKSGATFIANLPYGRSAQVDFSTRGREVVQGEAQGAMKMGVAGFFADYGESGTGRRRVPRWVIGEGDAQPLPPSLHEDRLRGRGRLLRRALNWARPSYGPAQRYPIQWDGDPDATSHRWSACSGRFELRPLRGSILEPRDRRLPREASKECYIRCCSSEPSPHTRESSAGRRPAATLGVRGMRRSR